MKVSPPSSPFDHRNLPYNFPTIEKEERENSVIELMFILLFIIGAVCAILMLVVHSQRKNVRGTSRHRLAVLKERTSTEMTEKYGVMGKSKDNQYV